MYIYNTDDLNNANKTLSLCMYVCMYVCDNLDGRRLGHVVHTQQSGENSHRVREHFQR